MVETKYIYGFRKFFIDLWVFFRILRRAISHFGFWVAFKQMKKYFKDTRCLFNTNPNRYVKVDGEIIAVSDMPPINSNDFINYVIQDIDWINNDIEPQLVFAIVCITSKCPFKCSYCYNSDLHTKEERLDIETIIKTIDSLIKKGVKSIYLSGGEPLMRWDDLLFILKIFDTDKTRFWLLSTGYNLSKDKLKQLKENGLKGVMISLDSFDADRINSVKCSDKAFDYAISALENAKNEHLLVTIDSVLGKSLLEKENFERFVTLAAKYGASFINCYTPRKMHHDLDDEYSNFTKKEFQLLEEVTTANQKSKKFKNMPIAYAPDIWEAKRGCVGGKLFIYIDPQGDVKICPFVNQSFGNIKEVGLDDILDEIGKADRHVCGVSSLLVD